MTDHMERIRDAVMRVHESGYGAVVYVESEASPRYNEECKVTIPRPSRVACPVRYECDIAHDNGWVCEGDDDCTIPAPDEGGDNKPLTGRNVHIAMHELVDEMWDAVGRSCPVCGHSPDNPKPVPEEEEPIPYPQSITYDRKAGQHVVDFSAPKGATLYINGERWVPEPDAAVRRRIHLAESKAKFQALLAKKQTEKVEEREKTINRLTAENAEQRDTIAHLQETIDRQNRGCEACTNAQNEMVDDLRSEVSRLTAALSACENRERARLNEGVDAKFIKYRDGDVWLPMPAFQGEAVAGQFVAMSRSTGHPRTVDDSTDCIPWGHAITDIHDGDRVECSMMRGAWRRALDQTPPPDSSVKVDVSPDGAVARTVKQGDSGNEVDWGWIESRAGDTMHDTSVERLCTAILYLKRRVDP